MQATGREAVAKAIDPYTALTVTDADEISPALRGHVALALQLGILDTVITDANGSKTARISPKKGLMRGEYAGFAARSYASVTFPS